MTEPYDNLDSEPLLPKGSPEWIEQQARYVYVIAHPHGYFKIGTSGYPGSRLGELQVGSPYELRILVKAEFEQAEDVEQCLHELLRRHHVSGEWFELTRELQEKLVDWVVENGSLFEFPLPEDHGGSQTSSELKERTLRQSALR